MSVRLAHGIGDPPADHPVAAVVALGANLGSRAETLAAAVEELRHLPLTTDVRVSAPIETVALTLTGEDADAPRYLNAVALLRTRLAPTTLLRELHRIEAEHGRVRREKWGDRTLDLDLITYGDERIDDERLTVPHPRAHEREFVLAPWVAIDPDAVIPGRGRVDALLAAVRGGAGPDASLAGGGVGQGDPLAGSRCGAGLDARSAGGMGQDDPSDSTEGKDTP